MRKTAWLRIRRAAAQVLDPDRRRSWRSAGSVRWATTTTARKVCGIRRRSRKADFQFNFRFFDFSGVHYGRGYGVKVLHLYSSSALNIFPIVLL